MAHSTIHNGGSSRGVIIALVVLAVFVAGLAMLGTATVPVDQTPTATTTPPPPVNN